MRAFSLVALAILLLSACGSTPSDSDLARAVALDDPLIGQIYLIRNVRRINGYERHDGYVIEFQAEIHILNSPPEYLNSLTKGEQPGLGVLSAIALATTGLAKWGLVTSAAIFAAKRGDTIPFSGSITMIKSEKGWILRPG